MNKIPVIDFNPYLTGDSEEKLGVSKELLASIKSYGFVFLKNVGISREQTENMFSMSKEFFQSPTEVKQAVKKSYETFCGYDQVAVEKLANDRPADLKESFMIKQVLTPWPSVKSNARLEKFQETMLDFHKKCFELGFNVLNAILLSLNVDPSIFEHEFNGECALLRLLHYPPMPEHIELNQLRCGEHTDYGAVSILFQDSVGGLEIKTKENTWMPVPAVENAVLVNIGDCLEIWTNGYLTATPHRVVNPKDDQKKNVSRYSSAFFFDPNLNCELRSLDKFETLKSTSNYSACKTYGDLLKQKYNDTYGNVIKEI